MPPRHLSVILSNAPGLSATPCSERPILLKTHMISKGGLPVNAVKKLPKQAPLHKRLAENIRNHPLLYVLALPVERLWE